MQTSTFSLESSERSAKSMITVLAGGVGAAKFLIGLLEEVTPSEVTAIVNVADDTTIHGLKICPDLDSCTYTLAGANDTERGWGLRGETWLAMEHLHRYSEANSVTAGDAAGWFNLGDRDLGTHLYRTSRLAAGQSLSEVTAEIAAGWGIEATLLPVTNSPIWTTVIASDGRHLAFQEYFVKERHDVEVESVSVQGLENAEPSPGVIAAIEDAEAVIIAPSNPIVSINPVLDVKGVREAVAKRRESVVAISPIVGGAALKGPADRLLKDLGHDPSVEGVARLYEPVAASLVIDLADEALSESVENAGVRCVVTDTIMRSTTITAELARIAIDTATNSSVAGS